ncbi:unnamed protein product [Ilex paraguariensis]|uniref:Uncharacterized protein n=1 Tax=Ilex paraguariensis TaxID=185542 RepID=A0ABC8RS02_9AQUA
MSRCHVFIFMHVLVFISVNKSNLSRCLGDYYNCGMGRWGFELRVFIVCFAMLVLLFQLSFFAIAKDWKLRTSSVLQLQTVVWLSVYLELVSSSFIYLFLFCESYESLIAACRGFV